MSSTAERPDGECSDIAVIGMGCRLPGAPDPDQFWRNLREGVESITRYTEEELLARGVPASVIAHPRYVPASGHVQDVECFDADFFGYVAREAQTMDPQHRLFLECSYAALEDAGYDPNRYPGLIGVYAGATMNTYLLMNLMSHGEMLDVLGDLHIMIGNDKEYLPTRVSYKLNLKGPSYAVQTACSSSLVAVHVACQAILAGECDMALAGGASVRMPVGAGYFHNAGGTSSPDGHCRAFDARSAGSVVGNGAGVVVLKYLPDALRDGDNVYAVIKGTAINNDGSAKVSFTAPSSEGQSRAVAAALAAAGLTGDDVTYVEAHGTGTPMGDPIEVAALTAAFRRTTDAVQSCAIGSVKTNIGHLDAAAGIASFIKTVQCLRHKMIPPTLHFETPNPEIGFEATPFYVASELTDWEAPSSGGPRRAGVHSLGMGGTNAHVVLEEAAPAPSRSDAPRPWQLLVLSAKTESALEKQTANLARWLREHPSADLADVAYTLQVGRVEHAVRRAVVARDVEDAVSALSAAGSSSRVFTRDATVRPPGVAFVFPGQGSQYVGMAAQLYETEPRFAAVVDECLGLLAPHMTISLREVVFKPKDRAAAERQLTDTAVTQPALFVVEYALAQLLMDWGVSPSAMLGHSIGEYVAACLAGVFRLSDALAVVAARGRLISKLPGGAMLSVPLSEAALASYMNDGLSIAAVNGPELVTVAGPGPAIEQLAARLAAARIEARRLVVSHAFHSAMMDPALDEFRAVLAGVELRAPQVPFVSNVTGRWIEPAQATDPEYWIAQLRGAVRFGPGLATLGEEPGRVLIEVGPGHTLLTLARQYRQTAQWGALAQTVRDPKAKDPDRRQILNAVAELWTAGVEVDWAKISGAGRRRVPLPTYPFERKKFWIDAAPRDQAPAAATAPATASATQPAHKHGGPEDWLFESGWQALPTLSPVADGVRGARVLVFADEQGVADAVVRRLATHGAAVTTVRRAKAFARVSPTTFTLDPAAAADWRALFAGLAEAGGVPDRVLVLWDLDNATDATAPAEERFERAQARGFYSLLGLFRALGRERQGDTPVRVHVVVQRCFDVTGEDPIAPERATALGICRVAPQETRGVSCSVVELDPRPLDRGLDVAVEQVLAEMFAAEAPNVPVVYRGHTRFRPAAERVKIARNAPAAEPRRAGVYLVVGGLGLIGSTFAEALLSQYGATVVVCDNADTSAPSGRRQQQRLARLRAAGGAVDHRVVNVADAAQLRRVVEETLERRGRLDGVIYAPGATTADSVGAIYELERPACELQFETKAHGVRALDAALEGVRLDFCLVTSSVSTVLGGIGAAAYASANWFMDAFVRAHNQRHPEQLWTCVNWEHWLEVADGQAPADDARAAFAVTPEEAVAVFKLLLGCPAGARLAVSTADLETRRARAAERESAPVAKPRAEAAARQPAPAAARKSGGRFVAPRDELERELAAAWTQFLGVEQVSVTDSFFKLGGDSLMAMQMVSKLRDRYGVPLPMTELFAAPTIEGLAKSIRGAGASAAVPEPTSPDRASAASNGNGHRADHEAAALEGIAAEMEQLDEGEIEALLASVESEAGGESNGK